MGRFIVGEIVEREKPCQYCGSIAFKVEPGTTVHAFHLRCEGCGKGGIWISKREARGSVERRALEWFARGDTGLSSEAIVRHLLRLPVDEKWGPGVEYPHDPSDLGRCLRLLEFIPELKDRMPEMASASVAWARLVPHWSELAATMAEEVGIDWSKAKAAPKTYALMKAVL